MPPETSTRCPFGQPLSGESSIATAAPMSSGSPALPSAVAEAIAQLIAPHLD
jgi:hypothetical protein